MLIADYETGPTGTNLILVLGGGALLTVTAWHWAGRSRFARWWVSAENGPMVVLGLLPAFGLLMLVPGLSMLFDMSDSTGSALFVPGMLLVLFLIVVGVVHLPRWWGPRWYWRLSDADRDPVGNDRELLEQAACDDKPTSEDEAEQMFTGQPVLESWTGGYVYDPDTNERTHTLAVKGSVWGHLTAYPTVIVFAAIPKEDALRQRTTVIAIPTSHITGARVVPARAGADGRRRKGWAYRTPWSRLVIDTARGPYLFELVLGRAKHAAERVRSLAVTPRPPPPT